MIPAEEEAWRSRLEEIGVSQVAEALRVGELWGEDRTQVARRWLSEKEREEKRRIEASISEQIKVARSAKNAAWVAAIAAIIAAIVAIAAAIISLRPHV